MVPNSFNVGKIRLLTSSHQELAPIPRLVATDPLYLAAAAPRSAGFHWAEQLPSRTALNYAVNEPPPHLFPAEKPRRGPTAPHEIREDRAPDAGGVSLKGPPFSLGLDPFCHRNVPLRTIPF
jgi:hypothetical protein